jgi:hypothetical protein
MVEAAAGATTEEEVAVPTPIAQLMTLVPEEADLHLLILCTQQISRISLE